MDEATGFRVDEEESFMSKKSIRSRKKSKSFNPSRDDVSKAMKDYLEKGGKIEKMESLAEDEMDRILSQFTGVQ